MATAWERDEWRLSCVDEKWSRAAPLWMIATPAATVVIGTVVARCTYTPQAGSSRRAREALSPSPPLSASRSYTLSRYTCTYCRLIEIAQPAGAVGAVGSASVTETSAGARARLGDEERPPNSTGTGEQLPISASLSPSSSSEGSSGSSGSSSEGSSGSSGSSSKGYPEAVVDAATESVVACVLARALACASAKSARSIRGISPSAAVPSRPGSLSVYVLPVPVWP